MDYILRKVTLPSSDTVTVDVTELWRDLFGEEEVVGTRAQFAGEETAFDSDTLYVLEVGGVLAACCHITRRLGTGLAMLGGVASATAFRGQGLGRAVCEFAMDDFDQAGGEAIWLCTGNPIAADLYESIGFHYQAGAHVMARFKNGLRSMELSKRLFPGGECVVQTASPMMRVPMIPLVCGRNNVAVLDANVALCSTGCMALGSCTGLYPRFLKVRERGGECLFMQDTVTGAVTGLATVVPTADGALQADAFWRSEYEPQAPTLIQALAQRFDGRRLRFPVADDVKARVLTALGAAEIGEKTLSFGRFTLPARILELALPA